MTSHLYAIADAGGNIYPGTFGTTRLDAQCAHISGGRREYSIPVKEIEGEWHVKGDEWESFASRGDHVVYCRIETNELTVVSQEPIP